MASPILELEGLKPYFPVYRGLLRRRRIGEVKAVDGVTLSLGESEVLGLVGESGCGKSTLARTVLQLIPPTAGRVILDGRDLTGASARDLKASRRDLQMVFQDPYGSLNPRLSVFETLAEPLRVHRVCPPSEVAARVGALMRRVGLSPRFVAKYPHEFSGGQRQRIAIARALALEPKVIVADEPVSALDVSIQAQILNLMRSLQQRHDLTYIVISHDLAVLKYLCDTIGVMYLGKLVELGPAEEIYAHAAHPYTQGLIDTIPVPDPALAKRRHSPPIQGELPSAMSPPSGCRFRTRCPFAQDRCAKEEPAASQFAPGHWAACHFPLQKPVADAPFSVGAATT